MIKQPNIKNNKIKSKTNGGYYFSTYNGNVMPVLILSHMKKVNTAITINNSNKLNVNKV